VLGYCVERPIVARNQFADDQTLALGSPALSPKGDRIAYQRYAERSGYQIWVSTVAAAGPPVQLTSGALYQDGPTWSPDGSTIAFIQRTKDNVSALAKVRVGAVERPTIILRDVPTLGSRPKWSPARPRHQRGSSRRMVRPRRGRGTLGGQDHMTDQAVSAGHIPVYAIWHPHVGPLLSLGMLTASARHHRDGALNEANVDVVDILSISG